MSCQIVKSRPVKLKDTLPANQHLTNLPNMPIRNQIEAVVQTLSGTPTFVYGTVNEQTGLQVNYRPMHFLKIRLASMKKR